MRSVLLVRTGAPSSPSTASDRMTSLPLERSDVDALEVVRVPLYVAVNFVLDLEKVDQRRIGVDTIRSFVCMTVWTVLTASFVMILIRGFIR
jgi:hypothetical protein